MSQFFTNYPKINYNIDKEKPVTTVKSINLMTRIKIKEIVNSYFSAYYPYVVKDYERPDTISYDYYGTVNLTWLILISNNIIDPLHDWPLSGNSFNNYIITKYGSIQEARTTIHHHEIVLRPETEFYTEEGGFTKILEKTAIVDEKTYLNYGSTTRKIVTNYDFEFIQNEKKRNIILIERNFAPQIQREVRTLF